MSVRVNYSLKPQNQFGYDFRVLRFLPPIAACLALLTALVAPATKAQPSVPGLDPIGRLQAQLRSGEVRLEHSPGPWGYLPSLLKALDIPVESQVLVFSKTSLQFDAISPKTPRAIYFNDDTAIGAVPGGRLTEITTTGADGRIAYYSLTTATVDAPMPEREHDRCISCHAAVNRWADGMIVANVIPLEDGAPVIVKLDRLFDVTDSTTPFDQRWGGWYVTGRHGDMRHRGNIQFSVATLAGRDLTGVGNVTDLSSRFDVSGYPAPTSDIVALMTLEHQLGVMNRLWILQAQDRALGNGAARRSTSTDVDRSVEDLVSYLVGANETPLAGPVQGVSAFTRTFAARGPKDAQGRSLREFDLQTRLFRYPLSYMIYSRGFDGLSPELRQRIYKRLSEVLSGADTSEAYARLPADGRKAALEILRATKADFPAS